MSDDIQGNFEESNRDEFREEMAMNNNQASDAMSTLAALQREN